jgi:pantoate--beta-alanine ligase
MKLFTTRDEMKEALYAFRNQGKSIGFVPTMGALHEGHLSLVSQAGKENELVVVSIFVNPTQFNDPADLERYPRTLEEDMKSLATVGNPMVFAPSVEEMYPEPDARQFDFGNLETVMEGRFRPGHFNGVGQIVSKLFDVVGPDRAYFGLKDFQQLAIIKEMVRQLRYDTEIVPCEIVREADGLAMSSRNQLLTPGHRAVAPLISQTLFEAKKLVGEKSVEELTAWVHEKINKSPLLEVEYFEIVDDNYLQPVKTWDEPTVKVGCIAVHAGKVRLIDNVILEKH